MSSGSSVWPPTSPPNLCGTTRQLHRPDNLRPSVHSSIDRAARRVAVEVLARGPGYPQPGLARFEVAAGTTANSTRYQIGPPTPERPGTVPSHPKPPTTPEAGPCEQRALLIWPSEAEGGGMLWFWLALFRPERSQINPMTMNAAISIRTAVPRVTTARKASIGDRCMARLAVLRSPQPKINSPRLKRLRFRRR
jgi:hypothetical protein